MSWQVGHKVRNRPRGWSASFCVERNTIPVKRARQRVFVELQGCASVTAIHSNGVAWILLRQGLRPFLQFSTQSAFGEEISRSLVISGAHNSRRIRDEGAI